MDFEFDQQIAEEYLETPNPHSLLEDIWWNNYCVDRQTSTHPTQITEKKWASQSDGGALYISDSFCFIYCYQTLSQESHYFFLDFKVLLQHSLVDRVVSEKLLSSSWSDLDLANLVTKWPNLA